MSSLRNLLLTWTVGAVTLGTGATAYFTFTDLRREIDELFDAQLAEAARTLLTQAAWDVHEQRERRDGGADEDEDDEEGGEHESDGDGRVDEGRGLSGSRSHAYEKRLVFQLWDAQGRLVQRSSRQIPVATLATRPHGFETRLVDGREFRIFSLWDRSHALRAEVAELTSARAALVQSVWRRVLVPGAVILPLLLLVLAIAVARAFRPLRSLSSQVAARAPDNLGALSVADAPDEVRPLVTALNDLLRRVDRALANERRFTADAAHELRTPLAAIKTQAQVALGARDAKEQSHALAGIVQGVDRASHLVQQLLTLARLDPEVHVAGTPLPLRRIVADVAAGFAPHCAAKSLDLTLEDGAEVTVAGDEEMVRVLLRNLLDNAVQYSPPGGSIKVRLAVEPAHVAVEILDSGPGLSREAIDEMRGRFARARRAGGGGSGLGLSIVERIVSLHGGTLVLDPGDAGKGLRVRVTLPR